MWKVYGGVRMLPHGLWDDKVSRGAASLDSRLMALSESFSECGHHYFVKFAGGSPCALLAVFFERETLADGTAVLNAVTGTPETCGAHFWFDPCVMTAGEFLSEAVEQILSLEMNLHTITFRDLLEDQLALWREAFEAAGFACNESIPVSTLEIGKNVLSLEDHISTLKSKHRYQILQYRRAIDAALFESSVVADFLPFIDEFYPLYLDVCSRAGEYSSPPYPKEYFTRVKEEWGDDAVMFTVRERTSGAWLGFMLLLYTSVSCVHQYIGFRRSESLFLWHNLTIGSIEDSIRRGIHHINMGVTNSVAKHKFGAVTRRCYVFSKGLTGHRERSLRRLR